MGQRRATYVPVSYAVVTALLRLIFPVACRTPGSDAL